MEDTVATASRRDETIIALFPQPQVQATWPTVPSTQGSPIAAPRYETPTHSTRVPPKDDVASTAFSRTAWSKGARLHRNSFPNSNATRVRMDMLVASLKRPTISVGYTI